MEADSYVARWRRCVLAEIAREKDHFPHHKQSHRANKIWNTDLTLSPHRKLIMVCLLFQGPQRSPLY